MIKDKKREEIYTYMQYLVLQTIWVLLEYRKIARAYFSLVILRHFVVRKSSDLPHIAFCHSLIKVCIQTFL